MHPRTSTFLIPLVFGVLMAPPAIANDDAKALYDANCGECHGIDRLGRMGPALLPENLKRLKKGPAESVIKNGRPATQMPPFGERMNSEQIQSLVEYIYTPLTESPIWGLEQMRLTHKRLADAESSADRPVFQADPMNLFIVVELGDHHATLLDGDRLEPIHRFKTHFALHGGPKYSPSGRFVYFGSRDGWVSKYDLYNLEMVAEVRAGINLRNIAVSGDGRYVMAANYLPHTLALLDAKDLTPLDLFEAKGKNGTSSRVSAVYTAPPRNSFIAALKDIPEVWEINYAEDPPLGFGQWVHDYRADSSEIAKPDRLPIRRITVEDFLDDFFFDQDYVKLVGASRDGNGQVLDLDLGRVMHRIDLPGMPHLGSGITWSYAGRPVLATPNLRTGEVSVIDMNTWQTIKRIETQGPGFFMRSHENTPYAWVDVFFGPNRDLMHVIDKRTLEIVKTLKPAPGKTSAHVEFTRDGKYALVSVWDPDGAVVIYDAETLVEVKRLPMNKPSGKYNVYNKVTLSSGTSH